MKKRENFGQKILYGTLGVFLIAVFLFFFIGENVLPPENLTAIGECTLYEGEWEQVLMGDTRERISVPGECRAKQGEWVTIETVLPQKLRDISFCIRSMQQDFRIYIGDELREEYSTVDTQLFGKTSTIGYVFFEAYQEDAGKTLRIEFMSDSSYAGYVSEVYMGDRIALWQYFIKTYAAATVVAMFLLILGIGVVVFCVLFRLFYKIEVALLHLGSAIIIASTWMIAESRLRQFILPNSTMAVYLGFFMIMFLPHSFAAYLNKLQNCRYQKAYLGISVAVVINSIFCTTLQLLQIKDFFETMLLSHAIIGALIVVIATTIILDIKRGYVKEYRAVALGFAGIILAALIEIMMVYINSAQYNGIPLCAGLVFLLFTAGMKTRRDVSEVERQRKIAIAASESKAQFLANVSHELRTPINTIVGMNEMILREENPETTKEYAGNIKNASEMLLGLVNDILDLSKIEAGKLQIVEGEYSLLSMLKAVVLGIEVRVQQKQLDMKLEMDENLPSILKGDEIRIKQILNNLLSNAVKYTDEGSITLTVRGLREEQGFFLELAVTDTGIGISEEDMEQLFTTFLRLDLKKNRHVEGTGLGLSITKQLAENMGGGIEVISEKGKGSCFKVKVLQEIVDETPIGMVDLKKQKPETVQKEQAEEADKLYAPEAKVLVVDDNEMNLKVIELLLKESAIQLDFASGGRESLEMSRKKKYDLILMDHMMPELDGIETLHLLRQEPDNLNKETPVIALTANAVGDMIQKYLEEGFSDYLSKPVRVEQLEGTLKKYL